MAMYLYGSVVLPELPEVPEEYKYACIAGEGMAFYNLILSTIPLYYSNGVLANGESTEGQWKYYSCLNGITWEGDGTYTVKANRSTAAMPNPVWANYTVYYATSEHIQYEYIYTATNNVMMNGSEPIPYNTTTSISIISPDSIICGCPVIITAVVKGNGDYDETATVTINGQYSNSTTLTKLEPGNNFMLGCGKDETAEYITVTATSVQDTTLTATKEIKVLPSSYDPSTDNPGGNDDPYNPGGGGGNGGLVSDDSAFLLGIAVGMKIKGKRVE